MNARDGLAGMLRAWRRRVIRRRPASSASLITGGLEAHIAAGSLSGIAPRDIAAHVLIVVTHEDEIGVSGTCPDGMKALIVAQAGVSLAETLLAERENDHDHGNGGAQ